MGRRDDHDEDQGSEHDTERLLHELRVQHVELEMQNHQLRTAQAELEASRARYADLYDDAPVGYCTLDPDGRIREINLTGAQLLGVVRADVIGQPLASFVAAADRTACAAHLRRCRREKARVTTELALPIDVGTPIVLQLVSTYVTSVDEGVTLRTMLIDITAQKILEARLRLLAEAGEHLASSLGEDATCAAGGRVAVPSFADVCLLDLVDDGGALARRDAIGGAGVPASILERLKGLDPAAGGTSPQAQVIAVGRSMHIGALSPAVVAATSIETEGTVDVLRAAGMVSIAIVPLHARGRIFGAMTFARTGRHAAYAGSDLDFAEELARRVAMALDNAHLYAQAQRAVHAREAVLALVSHDLRNPLGVILMRTGFMLEGASEPDRRLRTRTALESINRAATRMNRLIGDLLDISSIEAGRLSIERRDEEAASLVVEASDLLGLAASEKKVTIDIDVSHALEVDVFCDRGRILQVFENLIGNAIKFNAAGGHVRVSARRGEREVRFEVADDGPGVADADAEMLFDRFWRARGTNAVGSGLGLSIAKGIVEAHGGRIWVDLTVARGSTFGFTLPIAVVAASEAPRRGPKPSHGAGTVLIADDDREVTDALRETLEREGFVVAIAANGALALDYLRSHPSPLLVLLDLAMPVMDGWGFLRARAADPALKAIPVLVISAQTSIDAEVARADASVLAKPIDPRRLLESIAAFSA